MLEKNREGKDRSCAAFFHAGWDMVVHVLRFKTNQMAEYCWCRSAAYSSGDEGPDFSIRVAQRDCSAAGYEGCVPSATVEWTLRATIPMGWKIKWDKNRGTGLTGN